MSAERSLEPCDADADPLRWEDHMDRGERDWDRPQVVANRLNQMRPEGRPWPPHLVHNDGLRCSGCGALMRGKYDRCAPCTRRMAEADDD